MYRLYVLFIYFVYTFGLGVVSVNDRDNLYEEIKKRDKAFDEKIKEIDEVIEELKDEVLGDKE